MTCSKCPLKTPTVAASDVFSLHISSLYGVSVWKQLLALNMPCLKST